MIKLLESSLSAVVPVLAGKTNLASMTFPSPVTV